MQNLLLRAYKFILAEIEKEYYVPGFHVEFSEKGTETQINGLFLVGGLRGMLERKN